MNLNHAKSGFLLLCSLLFWGCTLHRVAAPEIPAVVPETFTLSGEVTPASRWWLDFADSRLDELQEKALAENNNLKAAYERLRAARAGARATGALARPSLDGSYFLSRQKTRFGGSEITDDVHNLGLSASYEVDVWGRLSARTAAAGLDAIALEADGEALAMVLTGAVASAYFSALEQHEQLALLAAQEEVNKQLLEVIETRFANGSANAVNVYQQREQLAAVQSQIPPAQARLATTEHLLATLLGEAPHQGVVAAGSLPQLPALPALGIPSDVLRSRPDVRAAMARVSAQDHRVGAAVADRYPSLRLGAGATTEAFFSDWLWSLSASIVGPIFDAGRRKAEVDRNQALLRQQLYTLEQVCLEALREVEDALALEARQHDLLGRLEHQLELARAAYDAGRSRYLNGVGEFLTMLTELQAAQRIERSLISARFQRIAYRISLYQALGGTPWTQDAWTPIDQEGSP